MSYSSKIRVSIILPAFNPKVDLADFTYLHNHLYLSMRKTIQSDVPLAPRNPHIDYRIYTCAVKNTLLRPQSTIVKPIDSYQSTSKPEDLLIYWLFSNDISCVCIARSKLPRINKNNCVERIFFYNYYI